MISHDPQTPQIIATFLVAFVISALTAYYATRKGRNPVIWFIISLFIGFLAPIILYFLPSGSTTEEDPTMTVSKPAPSLLNQPPTLPQLDSPEQQGEENKLWFYLDQNHQQIGPVSVIALRELWNTGRLELSNYVWSEGMQQWQKVEELPVLKSILSKP